jgi:hypothetical protein
MGFRLMCMFVSPEIKLHVVLLSTPNEVWTKLEVLFRIKEDCEERRPENMKTKPIEKKPIEQSYWLPPEADLKYDASYHSN